MDDARRWHAERILERCVGTEGVWAARDRYPYQCWTRDLVQAALHPLLDRDHETVVRRHLRNLARLQQPSGQVPILFLDGFDGHLRFLREKIGKSLRDRKLSFMLGRYLRGQLWNLTPGTRDSEIFFLIGVGEMRRRYEGYEDEFADAVAAALTHIERNLMVDGLVTGADWRDTMHEELRDKPLLTNNSLLYHAYRLLRMNDEAELLRARILATHFPGDQALDYPGNERFDPLGGAFAVLYDVVGPEYYPRLAEAFRGVDSPLGVTIKCRHNPVSPEEREIIERTDGVVVWPFVVGYATLALLKMGEVELAREQFAKYEEQVGFAEWYDPATGTPCGAAEQMWSAALYLRAWEAMHGLTP